MATFHSFRSQVLFPLFLLLHSNYAHSLSMENIVCNISKLCITLVVLYFILFLLCCCSQTWDLIIKHCRFDVSCYEVAAYVDAYFGESTLDLIADPRLLQLPWYLNCFGFFMLGAIIFSCKYHHVHTRLCDFLLFLFHRTKSLLIYTPGRNFIFSKGI